MQQSELKAYRNAVGISCKTMAKQLGCSAPLVNMVENGRKRFGKTMQDRFEDVYGFTIEWTTQPKIIFDRKVNK